MSTLLDQDRRSGNVLDIKVLEHFNRSEIFEARHKDEMETLTDVADKTSTISSALRWIVDSLAVVRLYVRPVAATDEL